MQYNISVGTSKLVMLNFVYIAALEIISVSFGTVRIRGLEMSLYICFDKRGRLKARVRLLLFFFLFLFCKHSVAVLVYSVFLRYVKHRLDNSGYPRIALSNNCISVYVAMS